MEMQREQEALRALYQRTLSSTMETMRQLLLRTEHCGISTTLELLGTFQEYSSILAEYISTQEVRVAHCRKEGERVQHAVEEQVMSTDQGNEEIPDTIAGWNDPAQEEFPASSGYDGGDGRLSGGYIGGGAAISASASVARVSASGTLWRVMEDMVRDEMNYRGRLRAINSVHTTIQADPKLLSKVNAQELRTMFGAVQKLAEVHGELADQWDRIFQQAVIGSGTGAGVLAALLASLERVLPRMTIYETYVVDYTAAVQMTSTTRQQSKNFDAYIRQSETKLGSSIDVLLSSPIDRMQRYVSFCSAIGDVPAVADKEMFQEVLDRVKAKVQRMHKDISGANSIEDMKKLLSVQSRLVGYEPKTLLNNSRKAILEGPIFVVEPLDDSGGRRSMADILPVKGMANTREDSRPCTLFILYGVDFSITNIMSLQEAAVAQEELDKPI